MSRLPEETKIERATEKLNRWGMTTIFCYPISGTPKEQWDRRNTVTEWMNEQAGFHGHNEAWHYIRTHDHNVYGIRDPNVALAFRMRFG